MPKVPADQLRRVGDIFEKHLPQHYYGLVEVAFKRDPRDGQYKLLDVNARNWRYHSLGQAAEVDFPYMAHADQLGEKVEPCRARVGVRWLRLVTDAPTGYSRPPGGNWASAPMSAH